MALPDGSEKLETLDNTRNIAGDAKTIETLKPPAKPGRSPPKLHEFKPLPRIANPQSDDDGDLEEAIKAFHSSATSSRAPAIPLRGVVQTFHWGKPWESSIVAAMATNQVRSRRGPLRAPPLNRGSRFAELWMGTHPNGHSSVLIRGKRRPTLLRTPSSRDVSALAKSLTAGEDSCNSCSSDEEPPKEWYLKDVIDQDPQFWLGEDFERRDLPFLFKVLSVRQALSVQAHPNKKLAEELHRRLPAHYPDANHKPEIAIPLGDFEALAGFRPVAQVRGYFNDVPELMELCGIQPAELESLGLRDMFSRLMRADKMQISRSVVAHVNRLKEKDDRSPEEDLILRVAQDYPADVGIFSIYFLNYVRISADKPHQFIFCAPDEPHAYLSGDCVECMALSDNVVRLGLTPKHKDVETMLEMLTYRDDLLNELVNVGEQIQPHVYKYNPPVDDFMVYEVDGPVTDGLLLPRASIAACVSGSVSVDFKVCGGQQEQDGTEVVTGTVPWSWRGPKRISKGATFFCRAGTEIYVLDAGKGSKLFIASY
mmetsp:Transcript_120125/g.224562  ORF Transcript_120125/g.224562 Transcript_120125/m.224562 type:complete len:539 (-) Transcript_120125:138-1754(-)